MPINRRATASGSRWADEAANGSERLTRRPSQFPEQAILLRNGNRSIGGFVSGDAARARLHEVDRAPDRYGTHWGKSLLVDELIRSLRGFRWHSSSVAVPRLHPAGFTI